MTQTAELTVPDNGNGYSFGYSVAISGSTVVTGIPYAGDSSQGAAYVTGPYLPITLSPTTLQNCHIGHPYSNTITTSGGMGTISLTVSDVQGTIPGLSLPTTGTGSLTIGGTPTAAGFETFTVTATDSAGDSTYSNYEIDVANEDVGVPSKAIFGAVVSDSNGNGVRDGSMSPGGTHYLVFAFDVSSSTRNPTASDSPDAPSVQDYEDCAGAGDLAQLIQAGVAQDLQIAIILFAGNAVVLNAAPGQPFINAETFWDLLNLENGSIKIDIGPVNSSGNMSVSYCLAPGQSSTTTSLSEGINYAAPLLKAQEILAALPDGGAGSQVLLFSDGNPDPQESASALQLAVSQLQKSSVTIHAYGFDSTSCSPADALSNLQQIDPNVQLYADSEQASDAFYREEFNWDGESGLAGVTVYLDLNDDGRLDPGDPSTETDQNGFYSFTDLSAGTYIVREVLPAGEMQTFPGLNGGYGQKVTVFAYSTVGSDSFDSGKWSDLVSVPSVVFGDVAVSPAPQPLPIKPVQKPIENPPVDPVSAPAVSHATTPSTAERKAPLASHLDSTLRGGSRPLTSAAMPPNGQTQPDSFSEMSLPLTPAGDAGGGAGGSVAQTTLLLALGETTVPPVNTFDAGDLSLEALRREVEARDNLDPISRPTSPKEDSSAQDTEKRNAWPWVVPAAVLAASLGMYAWHRMRDKRRNDVLEEIIFARVASMQPGGDDELPKPPPERPDGPSHGQVAEKVAAEDRDEIMAIEHGRLAPVGDRRGRLPLEAGETT
jgi:hypothetical protein